MAKPLELTLIRHGESEINVVSRTEKNKELHPDSDVIYGRHDFEHRLTPRGVEQALTAREWLIAEGKDPEDYDERYVSPCFRTLETAAYIGGATCLWLPDANLVERSWGVFGNTPAEEREKRFQDTIRQRTMSSFFARLDGGESISDGVTRYRDHMGTLERDQGDKRVLEVAHGEIMWIARFVIERMLPHEWQELDMDKSQSIHNCNVLSYTRINPDEPADIRSSLSAGWRRIVDPVNPARSPFDGEWVKLPGKRRFNQQELLSIVSAKARLLQPILNKD